MGRPEGIEAVLAAKFQVLLPHLDERQRRLAIGAEALSLGHGGIRIVAAAAGVREATVSRGAAELDSGQAPLGWARHPGGGRKKAAELDSGLRPALLALVEPDERGDPMSPLRWTTKSTRKLAAELTRQGHRVSADTVAGLLREEGFSLQANAKTIEPGPAPRRRSLWCAPADSAVATRQRTPPKECVQALRAHRRSTGASRWRKEPCAHSGVARATSLSAPSGTQPRDLERASSPPRRTCAA